jgi:DNA (cytosine-5)-methyltransferase 1
MMAKPKVLDLFGGEGGAGYGYTQAGFDVYSVDNNIEVFRSHYETRPNRRIYNDALRILEKTGHRYDAYHASPPCQRWCTSTWNPQKYPNLISPVRELLSTFGKPFVIENVPNAPLRSSKMLCGTMFPDLRVYRHRDFETFGFEWETPEEGRHTQDVYYYWDKRRKNYKQPYNGRDFIPVHGDNNATVELMRMAMGNHWMTKKGIVQSIPWRYTEYIGKFMMEVL